ncbi:MAG: flagellar M-ring protein FliF [Myxococcales bacterium FL481]|nr:MAG: flagellar M-ring protein FliF [Myxococcales bacterium FL481]
MDGLKQFFTQIRDGWNKTGPRLRAVTVFVLLVVLTGLGLLASLGGAQHGILFAGLDPRDGAAVVAALDTAKIPYRIESGGSVITVPTTEVGRARMLLAEQDLPRGGNVGFELFAEQNFGLTDFAQRVNYKRALQGELERTIGSIAAVSGARVHITTPERAVFEDEISTPTASVTVDLLPGRRLTSGNVGAITYLVAAAVDGLAANDVTVLDTGGNLLSRPGTDAATAAALDYKRDLEQRLEKRVRDLLERTVGVGGAQVTISADIDFNRVETTEEIFDPEQTAVRSEATQEAYEGKPGAQPQGLAGALANEPGAEGGGLNRNAANSSRLVKSKNYEVNRTVVHTTGPGAEVKRLTVAVLVDGTYTPAEDGTEPVFSPVPADKLADFQQVVEHAVGYNAARGDRIKISSVPFVNRPPGEGAVPIPEPPFPAWLPYAVGGGVLALIAAAMVVLRRGRRPEVVPQQVLQFPATVEAAQEALARAENSEPGELPEGDQPALPDSASLREQVIQTVEANPERTAEIVKSWIGQEAS